MPNDEAHANVAKARGAEVIAGVEKRGRVVHVDALLHGQLAQALVA